MFHHMMVRGPYFHLGQGEHLGSYGNKPHTKTPPEEVGHRYNNDGQPQLGEDEGPKDGGQVRL